MGIGWRQVSPGNAARAAFSCERPIRRARRPPGFSRLAATGSISTKCSTARRVTMSKLDGGRVSARVFCILTSVNVRERAVSRRKAAFLWLDSMSVRAMFGTQSLMGIPGKPAPEPRSATVTRLATSKALNTEYTEEAQGKRWRAAKRDSPKWRVTIFSGSRMAVRLMRAFQRRSISIYVDISWSWDGERTASSFWLGASE